MKYFVLVFLLVSGYSFANCSAMEIGTASQHYLCLISELPDDSSKLGDAYAELNSYIDNEPAEAVLISSKDDWSTFINSQCRMETMMAPEENLSELAKEYYFSKCKSELISSQYKRLDGVLKELKEM